MSSKSHTESTPVDVHLETYFSVPLAIARRKLSGLRDSLVTSSVWKPDFKKSLEKSPEFRLEQLDFSIPMCDACHLGNRVSTLRAVLSGKKYDHTTYEVISRLVPQISCSVTIVEQRCRRG